MFCKHQFPFLYGLNICSFCKHCKLCIRRNDEPPQMYIFQSRKQRNKHCQVMLFSSFLHVKYFTVLQKSLNLPAQGRILNKLLDSVFLKNCFQDMVLSSTGKQSVAHRQLQSNPCSSRSVRNLLPLMQNFTNMSVFWGLYFFMLQLVVVFYFS